MTVDDSEILKTLCESFDNAVVYEESWPSPFKLAKLFPAMGRSHGGILLLGIRDDRTIVGVEESDLKLCRQRFENLCVDLLDFTTEVGVIQASGRNVVFVLFNLISKHRRRLTSIDNLILDRNRP
ncbi:MAG: hypothetical protein ACI8UO_000652 [Verrucomicrobiales bacterium]|jgi:hypothetical protein